MKTVHKNRSGGESCSCTTCVYKRDSDHPSLRRIIDLGSRIDRLYYGKYIPLRERKLLQRLVRTRAVYDDIRAQLVSESTLSVSSIGDYNPREKFSIKELDDIEKSSGGVLELVNMVDRGALGSKKLDNCCSCCSCSSNIKIPRQRHVQQRSYEGAVRYLAKQKRLRDAHQKHKGVRFKTKHVRSDPCACTFELIKKRSKALYKRMQQGPPVPVDIRPIIDEKVRQNIKRIGDIASTSYKNLMESTVHVKEKISEGLSKLRESQTQIQEKIEFHTKASIEKLNQAKVKLASKLREIRATNENENQLAFHVKKDSIGKYKEKLRRKQLMKDWECEPECIEGSCVPKVFFNKLMQRKINRKNIHHRGTKYYIPTEDRKARESLLQSYYKTQPRKLSKEIIEIKKPVIQAQQTRGIKVSNAVCKCSSDKVPKKIQNAGRRVNKILNETENKNNILRILPIPRTPEKNSVENVKANNSARKFNLEDMSLKRKSSQRQTVRIGSSFSFNIEFYKYRPTQEIQTIDSPSNSIRKPVIDKNTKKKHFRQKFSQIEQKKSLKDTQTGGHALKRCFCTLKLKAKTHKSKTRPLFIKREMSTETSELILNSPTELTFKDVQTNIESKLKEAQELNLLPNKCDPGVCLPGQCDPYQCIKLINLRKVKHRNSGTQARKTKSISRTSTSRPYKLVKAKNVQSKVNQEKLVVQKRNRQENRVSDSHRQAVRIGSTFSFNIEFYKRSPFYQQSAVSQPSLKLKRLSVKPKQKEHREAKLKSHGYLSNSKIVRRNTPTQIIKKQRNARIGTTLKRCFCTLALQRTGVLKNYSTRTFITATETSDLKPLDTANKATKTKFKYSKSLKLYECEPYTCVPEACDPYTCLERINLPKKVRKEIRLLEPYECEPFTCVPGKCDPYVCLKRINKRTKRLKDIGLTPARSKTISSSTSPTNKSLKAIHIQHKPRHKEQKMLVKTQKPKKYADNISKQAVKIGSTFSFNIEFFKNKSPNQKVNHKYPLEKPEATNRSINKKVKMNRLNVSQVKTQVQKPKKRNKGSVVGPLLKRCFCTLNLQKNWKRQYYKNESLPNAKLLFEPPRVYTVNTVMIGYTKGHSQQCVKRLENYVNETDTVAYTTCSSLSSQTHDFRLSSRSRFFQRCFYAMNVIVENRNKYKNKEFIRRKKHKLLPYECEPGVCIPDECNPYVCQKMIAKRLNKKKSSTNYTPQFFSSANQTFSKSKEYKKQMLMKKLRRPQVYEDVSQDNEQSNIKNRKQVRIGSSFSFDILFSKNLSSPKHVILSKYSSDTNLVAKRVKESSKSNGANKRKKKSVSQSQSASIKTVHKGSFAKATRKRCFCTLKLQKKGRLHKEFKNRLPGIPIRQLNKENTVSRGQNTKQVKPLRLTYVLEPYECEPNICIPGQCDPLQCLERIKERNHNKEAVGTNTIFQPVSGTNTDSQRKKIHKGSAAGKETKYMTGTAQDEKIYSDYSNSKSLRQAVRVGSSFSFNIEFFKEHPSLLDHRDTHVIESSIENKRSIKPSSTLEKHADNKILRNKDSQLENNIQHASTLTNALIERCFCTSQLYRKTNNGQKATKQEYSHLFLRRCFCFIKKIKPSNKTNTPKIIQNKKTNTRKIQDKPKLEQYECKPGICMPSECDPYECEKIMRKYRNESCKTDPVKTKSVSSYTVDVTKKNAKTLRHQDNLNTNNRRVRGHKVEAPITEKPTPWKPNRNVVRIGSKFNFNIEFSKDHPTAITTKIKHQKFIEKVKDIDDKKRVGISSIKTISPSHISQSSQIKKMKVTDRGVGIHNLIKRCFCKLKLNKKHESNKKSKPIMIVDPNIKKDNEKFGKEKQKNLHSAALLPYECEPSTCTPYNCDPIKCQKRIKLRHKKQLDRGLGVVTSYPNKKSASSLTRIKNPETMSQFKNTTKNLHTIVKQTPRTYADVNEIGQFKKSVRIGSTFSFNIEFSKDKLREGFQLQKKPKIDKLNSHLKDKNVIIKNQSNQNQIMRTQSTMTNFVSNQRCFCTLSLLQSGISSLPIKPLHASTETDVKRTMIHPISNLLPYECEPNVCVPGKCDPFKCLRDILERNSKFKTTMTKSQQKVFGTVVEDSARKSVATMTKKRKDAKMKRTQVRLSQPLRNKQVHTQNIGRQLHRIDSNYNRQVVRIGSNFSFDIEFYKTNNLHSTDVPKFSKIRETGHLSRNIAVDNVLAKKKLRDLALKPPSEKKASHGSSMVPFLKRCYCALKLQKSDFNKIPVTEDIIYSKKPKKQQVSSENKSTARKKISNQKTLQYEKLSPFECEPFYCIPGACDPHQCARRIELRENKRKEEYTITKSPTRTQKVGGIKLDNMKSRRNQTQFIPKNLKSDITEIAEVPKATNVFKNQSVRIGSDFNFNIEFYKENLQLPNQKRPKQVNHIDYKRQNNYNKLKRSVHNKPRGQNTKVIQMRNSGSGYNRTNNKVVEVENTLKRCFCTLKLQNKQSVVPFPQNTEIRRVAVQQNTKMLLKESNLSKEIKTILPYMPKKFNKTASRAEFISENKSSKMGKFIVTDRAKSLTVKRSETLIHNKQNVNPVKIKHKSFFGIKNFITWCSKIFHRNSYPVNFSYDKKINYKTPIEKINFYTSKCQTGSDPSVTNLKVKKINQTCPKYLVYQSGVTQRWPPRESFVSNKKKQLNKSIHKKGNKNLQITGKENHKDMGCTCSMNLSHKKQNTPKSLNMDLNLSHISSKINNIDDLNECHIWNCGNYKEKSFSKDKGISFPGIHFFANPKSLNKDSILKHGTKCKNINYSKGMNREKTIAKDNTCCCLTKYSKIKLNSKNDIKRNNSIDNLNACQTRICRNKKLKEIMNGSSKNNSTSPRVRFLDTTMCKSKSQYGDHTNMKKKSDFASSSKSEKIVKSSNYCHCKDKMIIQEELIRAAGDQQDRKTENVNKKWLSCSSVEKIMNKIKDKVRCAMSSEKPMLEMQIDSRSYEILNRNEVLSNVAKLKTKCKPVIEMQIDPKMYKVLNKDALNKIINSETKSNTINQIVDSIMDIVKCQNKIPSSEPAQDSKIRKPTRKPCICGSPVCAKKVKNMTKPKIEMRLKWKTCSCGSPICNSESAKIKTLTAKVKNQCLCKKGSSRRNARKKELKQEKKEHDKRMKYYEGKDKARRRARKKKYKALEKRINKKTPDAILFAESVLDVGQFGVTASCDLLRKVCRYARNPKDAVYTLRALRDNPKFARKFLKYHDTGLLKRIRLRCLAMKGTQKLKDKLQSFGLTNYLININNPKRRLLKKKLPRQRERKRDYNCSLYMASLRKKRCLAIYDRCPWFYQHFLALVRAGKQFIDVFLFLLAIVFWSPCILCMEICRACMCCFFCNG